MKILSLNNWNFKLSDNFKGNLEEAFMEVIEYILSKGNPSISEIETKEKGNFEEFISSHNRISGDAGIMEYDQNKKTFTHIS